MHKITSKMDFDGLHWIFNEFLIKKLDLNFYQNNVPYYLLRLGINLPIFLT
jgi:hypothetical protein